MTLRVTPDEIVGADTTGLLGIHPTWERVRLGDVARVQNGFPFPSSGFSQDKGMPLLRIRDVGANSPSTYFDGLVDPEFIVEVGDIVVGMDGDFRTARWRGKPAALNQRVCRIVPVSEHVDPRFLFVCLQPYLDAVNKATSAVTVKHLSSKTVQDLPLPLPPLAEQGRIVAAIEEAFSLLEAGETALHNTRTRLKRMRDSVLTAAVTGQLVPQDPTDTPADKHLADLGVLSLSDARPQLPESWCSVALGDVTSIGGGIQKQPKRRPSQNPVPFLRVANVGRGSLDLSEVHDIEVFEGELDRYRLRVGDLLVVEGNGSPDQIGRAAVWGGQIAPCVHQNHLIRVRPGPAVDAGYLGVYWNSPEAAARVQAVASSTSGLHTLSTGKLKGLPVTLPPLEEQSRIVAEVERQFSFIEAAERAVDAGLARSKGLRRSVLKAAFEGRLVEQDPADEPASVLLERIAAERAVAAPRRRAPRGARGKVVAS